MAIYHASMKIISRSAGRSSVAAAAYRAGVTLHDQRDGRTHDYSRKSSVTHSEIMAPEGAPEWVQDRQSLWNAVETVEKRKDSQLARELEVALPRELAHDQRVELMRGFLKAKCVDHGMVADFSIHEPKARDGEEQPHAHIMLTMRRIDGTAFGKKATEWSPEFGKKDGRAFVADTSPLMNLREAWAEHCNAALERAGLGERVDHRSLRDQRAEALAITNDNTLPEPERRLAEVRAVELDRQPEPKIGAVAAAMDRQGRGEEARALREALVVRQERNQLRELGHELRQVVDQAAKAIEAGREQLGTLWKRVERAFGRYREDIRRRELIGEPAPRPEPKPQPAVTSHAGSPPIAATTMQRPRQDDPLQSYREDLDRAGNPYDRQIATARLDVATEYHAASKNPRHHSAAIIQEADRRLLVALASPQVDAPAVQQVAPQPDPRKVYEAITKEVDEQVNRIAVSIQKQAKERMHNAADIEKDALHKLTLLDENKPKEPTGFLARFKRNAYEQELGEWQKERSSVKIIYDVAGREYKEMQKYAADFSDFYKTRAKLHARDNVRKVNPEMMKKFDEAKKEFDKHKEKERPAREAVQQFKSMASSREHGSYGYGDTGEHWRRIPDDLKSAIEAFNATPKDQRATILEAMTQRLNRDPQALKATQHQLEQSRGHGIKMGRS